MKSTEEFAAEKKWLDEAKAYSDSRGWSLGFDFTIIDEWEWYYNRGYSGEHAVDDRMVDTEYEGD